MSVHQLMKRQFHIPFDKSHRVALGVCNCIKRSLWHVTLATIWRPRVYPQPSTACLSNSQWLTAGILVHVLPITREF